MRNATVPRRSPSGRSDRRPCVLVVTDDFENLVEVRVRIPFDAMYEAGLIRGYHVLHRGQLSRSVGIPAEIGTVDVVWVQRVPARNVLFVVDALGGRFVYDIDDNLLVAPSYQAPFSHTVTETVRTLLREAKVVSTTNARLLGSLQARSALPLEGKSVIAPNMTEEVNVSPGDPEPEALLLATSGRLPLTASSDGFMRGVKRFLGSHGLPVFYIGNHVEDLSALGPNVGSTGFLDYSTYRDVIRGRNAIAIAPLEGRGDPTTQEFVEGKSDIKMVEFGSCGIPAVYADVAPYRDTPLRCGPLVDMGDERAVEDALTDVFRGYSQIRSTAEESVRRHRLALTCVPATWFAAVDAGRLPEALPLEGLLERAAGYAALSLSLDAQLAVLRDRERGRARPPYARAHEPARPGPPPASALERPDPRMAAAPREEPLFDPAFYLRTYTDVGASGMDPYQHYLQHGIADRRDPNPFFDTRWYIRRHPEAGLPGVDPLRHYAEAGLRDDMDPSSRFSRRLYRILNPGLGDVDPLEHFLNRTKRR